MLCRRTLLIIGIVSTVILAISCANPVVLSTAVPTTAPPPQAVAPTATPAPPAATLVPTATLPSPSPTVFEATPSPMPPPIEPPATATLAATIPAEPGGEHAWEVTDAPRTPGSLATEEVTPTPAGDTSGASSLDAVIPPAPGRDLLYNNCTSCHSVVCSLIGQRTQGNWETIRKGHADRVPGLSQADQDVLYAYLVENFSDSKPEPELPPELREQGCSAQ